MNRRRKKKSFWQKTRYERRLIRLRNEAHHALTHIPNYYLIERLRIIQGPPKLTRKEKRILA